MNEDYRAYWDCEPEHAPANTGAGSVMNCADLWIVFTVFDIPRGLDVLDVGCGTGRLSQMCGKGYVGYDISPGCVKYAQSQSVNAHLIDGITDIQVRPGRFNLITCLSVFTHINTESRIEALQHLHKFEAPMLADIIEGDGDGGSIAVWQVSSETFKQNARDAGWSVIRGFTKSAPDGTLHTYFLLDPVVGDCLKCDDAESRPWHVCPYSQELHGSDNLCRCCESCTQECANEI